LAGFLRSATRAGFTNAQALRRAAIKLCYADLNAADDLGGGGGSSARSVSALQTPVEILAPCRRRAPGRIRALDHCSSSRVEFLSCS
jgi:hypothetical protein